MKEPEVCRRFRELVAGATEQELKLMAIKSPAIHFSFYTTICDKNNKNIRPVPNVLQLKTSEVIETLEPMGVRIRIIEVKPRRAGCSTFASHCVYHKGMRDPIEGITISDIKPHSAELMDKLRDYSRRDSYPWGHRLIQDSASSLAWSNGTKWTIDTAENPDAGVGGTRQAGHFSEVSKWPQTNTRNDKKTMAAVLPSLSGSGTLVIAESTPEGAQGWHYSTWQEAVSLEEFLANWEKGIRPEEVWIKVFAAWFEFHDNARAEQVSETEIREIKATLDEHERYEIDKYELTWEQIAWRRDTIKSVCHGDPKVFSYYYPSDEFTCWLASGSPRFDMQAIAEMEARARSQTPDTGYLVTQEDGKVVFQAQQDGTGDILIWEQPKVGLKYCVIIDPAGNKSQTIGADPDAHAICVWRAGYLDTALNRWMPAKKVARVLPPYHADGDEVAGHGVRLSNYYGRCITAQEVNIGLDILRLLQAAGIPLYKRRPLSHRTGKVEEQIGFKMDHQNREAIIEGLAAAIRERDIEVYCPHTLLQYKSFVRKRNGRAEASAGQHDDDVITDAIAWEVMPSATEYRVHKAQHRDPPDERTWKRTMSKW